MIKELIERFKKNRELKYDSSFDNSTLIFAGHLKTLTEFFSSKKELETSVNDYGNIKNFEISYKKKGSSVEVCEKYRFIDNSKRVSVFDSSLKFKEIAQVFALDDLFNNNKGKLDKNKLTKVIKCSKLKLLNRIIKQNFDVYEILNNSKFPINDIIYVASIDENYNKDF